MSSSTRNSFANLVKELESFLSEEEDADSRRCLEEPGYFVQAVLGYEFEEFHRRWFEFQLGNRHTLILAPRGHGKSTICTVSYSLYTLAARPDTRILLVSNTADQADALLREIRLQVETNRSLGVLFGFHKGALWRESKFVLGGRARVCKEASVTSVGVDGAIVSRHYELIILDDVVDEENSHTQDAREKLRTWYAKVLVPCLEPCGELHVLGTRYHPQDLYETMISNGTDA